MPLTRRSHNRGSEDQEEADEDSPPAATPSSSNPSPPADGEGTPQAHKAQGAKETKQKRYDWTKDKLTLKCHWLVCEFSTSSMKKFNAHVAKHVPISADPGNTYERCRWADCKFQTADEREIARHVIYHAYHGRLMARGAAMVAHNRLRPCSLDSSERHVLPDLTEPFVCYWDNCNVEFDDAQGYFWHVEHHITCHYQGEKVNAQRPAKCFWYECETEPRSYQGIREHVRIHTREKPIACATCGIVFANYAKLEDHTWRQVAFEDLRYQCSHCLRLYATERLLREHIRHHINNFRCQHCTMTVPSLAGLRMHVLYKHNEERNFICPKCNKRCKAPLDLERHLKRHEIVEKGERHHCPHPGCRFVFREAVRLKKHYNKVHCGEPRSYYFCHICDDVRYLSPSSMSTHLKKFHHLALPEGHSRFRYRRGADGHFRLQTLRYESLEVAEQAAAAAPEPTPAPPQPTAMPDVLALSCQDGDVPDTITTDDGRELHLPETVRRALATGRRVLVCVQGDQVQMLARMEAMDELRDPDDPDALMMVVDGQAVAVAPAAEAD